MKGRQRAGLMSALLMLPAVLFGATKAYDVVPYSNCVAQAPEYEDVIQTYINVLDSLTMVSVWVGDVGTGLDGLPVAA